MLCKEASKHCWVSYSVVVSGGEDDRQKSLGKEKQRKERNRLWQAAGSPEGCPAVPASRHSPPNPVSSSLGSLGGALVGTPHCRCPMLPGCVIMGKSS